MGPASGTERSVNKTPDYTILCPACFGAGEITFEDERYGAGFGRFQSSIPCSCRPVQAPREYVDREFRQRLEVVTEEAELYLRRRDDLDGER